MRALACVLCVVALGCSFVSSAHKPNGGDACMRSRHPAQIDTAIAVSLAAAFAIALVFDGVCAAHANADCSNQGIASVVTGAAALLVGTPFMGGAIYGYEKETCIDPEAETLARRAIEAAHGGDCPFALAIEPEVREGDPDVYARLLVPDPDFARCAKAARDAAAHDKAERNAWCLDRRREITEKANALEDPDERAKLLATMPLCL
ncbi:MAG TPA: hypothetical protein VGG28_35190 [Kofleriaceae bacterium]|jgi:hypothetical protein